jgi:hypothetical protein
MKNKILALGSLVLASQLFAAEVITQDLIVDGSTCVGTDCTSAETFGFSTIKMRENNTRITFEDTSSSGAFPNIDWQLTANDSQNGGRNRFSIEDLSNEREILTVMGNAPNYSLFVDESGRLGLGTDQPDASLHVMRPNAPTLRLEQTGAGGFPAAVWDVAANEAGLEIALDGESLLTVDTSGNVRLAGSLTAGTPASTFPDYVFNPQYKLMPLHELQDFVNAKRHLPEIPSAQEVGESGLNMTEFQVKLLKKVEELTLYTLQQQEEIKALQQALMQQ